jgi:hypothetical protein
LALRTLLKKERECGQSDKGEHMVFILLGIFALAPPSDVRAYDTPDDGGGSITVEWQLSPDDEYLDAYEIYRSEDGVDYGMVGLLARGRNSYEDESEDGKEYYYKIAAVSDTTKVLSQASLPAVSSPQWFNTQRLFLLAAMLIFSSIIIFYIYVARRGKELYIRKIAGLEAVEDAVGRATEMGKPVLYVIGIGTMSNIASIASLNILSEVAKKAGQYETPLIAPQSNPIVYTVAREIVKESYTSIGRPDLFDTDKVFFVTQDQFAYAAAVDGIMLREKPGANFLIGWFRAESLIIAETGAISGAIQIAGTDAVSQLPFFVTACDYTIIGEELYAASAYLSKEPMLLSAVKGEDIGKIVIFAALGIATIIGLLTRFPILSLFD